MHLHITICTYIQVYDIYIYIYRYTHATSMMYLTWRCAVQWHTSSTKEGRWNLNSLMRLAFKVRSQKGEQGPSRTEKGILLKQASRPRKTDLHNFKIPQRCLKDNVANFQGWSSSLFACTCLSPGKLVHSGGTLVLISSTRTANKSNKTRHHTPDPRPLFWVSSP